MKASIFRLLSAGTLALATLSLAESCKDDDDLGLFSAYFYPTRPQGIELYADQTIDSTAVVSTVSWDIAPQYTVGDGGWLALSPTKADVVPNLELFQRVHLTAEANTTGFTRTCLLAVNLHSDRIDGIAMPVKQLGWLNITVPQPRFTTDDEATMQPIFEHTLKATDVNATMVCHLHENATLSSDAAWLTIPEDLKNIEKGDKYLLFNVARNTTGAERTAQVTITSAKGCSNVVTYTQKPE